uniref:C-type lectin domain-containing protein n=1 Tax=Pseudonaja textilis TaxID=8673 RepID=A0A670Z1J1_PSETE
MTVNFSKDHYGHDFHCKFLYFLFWSLLHGTILLWVLFFLFLTILLQVKKQYYFSIGTYLVLYVQFAFISPYHQNSLLDLACIVKPSQYQFLTLFFSSCCSVFPCGADTRQWEYFGGKCYFFSLKTIPWHAAKVDCESKQSQLAVIDSLAKQNFIQTRTRNERFWIGLHDQFTEGEWKWLDGSNYRTGFQNWKEGEPNTYQGREEDCGQVWINGEWNDYICSSDSFYICEKPRPSTPKTASNRP